MSSTSLTNNDNSTKINTVLNSGLTASYKNRFCIHCNIKLVNNPYGKPDDKYVYKCPQCGVITNIYNTQPQEKIITTFPTADPTTANTAHKHILQATKDGMSRSQYFIAKNLAKRNENAGEEHDPHLRLLKQNNKIRITNIDY